MLSKTFILVAALASTVIAAPCNSNTTAVSGTAPTPTLPSTGATDLPAPDSGMVLKKIALGHGIQNYTCSSANATATADAKGALAVLYDITSLYPGTPGTGLANMNAFNGLSTSVLWSQKLPLNIAVAAAAFPGTQERPNVQPEANYGADVANPFPAPTDLQLGAMKLPYIGVHYFDVSSVPTFDLTQRAGMLGVVAKKDDVKAPTTADKGVLSTGAVDWLRLLDNEKGLSKGVTAVFRVVTAGGAAQACSQSGVGSGSVPYAAQYWFYGA